MRTNNMEFKLNNSGSPAIAHNYTQPKVLFRSQLYGEHSGYYAVAITVEHYLFTGVTSRMFTMFIVPIKWYYYLLL